MKQKLTITVDSKLLPIAKRYARSQGVSLSSLIERFSQGGCRRGCSVLL